MPSPTIKLSAPSTREFWEIDVLFEDEHLLALSKPACLLTSPDRYDPHRPNLMRLLHDGIAAAKPWAASRGLSYLSNAHRLDFETTGILLMAKSKPTLVALAALFGENRPRKTYSALVSGCPAEDRFVIDAPLGQHPTQIGLMRVDPKRGKQSRTEFEVVERFDRYSWMKCHPITGRTHQIRVHLQRAGYSICGDSLYGGEPLLLSRLKPRYELKDGRVERPLIQTVALHAEELSFDHPMTGVSVDIRAPWPKDLTVALKYLRRHQA
ncbi:MAG: RluA family pseudouridine synthase [Verrucomicrobia bacterium]|nr:RluA family pseudouridine synthase [Verrucomicrobiota bacterium]MBI3867605.1 RluA family pseudouridine synthase [Verrucomicrobiota bacterium]